MDHILFSTPIITDNKIHVLNDVYQLLHDQKDLSPNNEVVNRTLIQLVRDIIAWQEHGELTLDKIQKEAPLLLDSLPSICAQAECEMEKWWCQRILTGCSHIEDFWYFEHYKKLVSAEAVLFHDSTEPLNFVFLGSGALPFTALLLIELYPSCTIRCVDYDKEACDLAAQFIERQGISRNVSVCLQLAEEFVPQEGETVICASLLNSPAIYSHLNRYGVKRILVRDVEGLYQLLYKPAMLPGSDMYKEICRTELNPFCINISRYFMRCSV